MYTLLELAFKNTNLSFEYIMTLPEDYVERVIYDRIVERSRDKIRKALRKHKMQLTLQMIYAFKNDDMIDTCFKFLGFVPQYSKSIWRLATYYAICTFISNNDDKDRIREVIYDMDMVLPYGKSNNFPYINVKQRMDVLDELFIIQHNMGNTDITMYTNVYMKCGKYLYPNEK